MKLLLLFCYCCAMNAAQAEDSDWKQFKEGLKLPYRDHGEEQKRQEYFQENLKAITEHNERYAKGLVNFSMEMNHMGDLEPSEMSSILNGFNPNGTKLRGIPFVKSTIGRVLNSIDWRENGAVTAVKNQGKCASCWAFSAIGAVESHSSIKSGDLVNLSEQDLIDCSESYGTMGCDGGSPKEAYEYIKRHGIQKESLYPYRANVGTCRPGEKDFPVGGFVDIPLGDEEALKLAVANFGPVSVGIDATSRSFMFYRKGVYFEKNCDPNSLNHAVLVVGYGTENGIPCWIVKNSWGASWGDNGYIKMARNRDNNCGIATSATYPIIV